MTERSTSWFRSDENAALQDAWSVWLRHFDEICAACLRHAAQDEHLGTTLRALGEERTAALHTSVRTRLEQAIAGDWDAYEDDLREHGAAFARMRIPFVSWFVVARSLLADLVPLVVAAYAREPARLTGALDAFATFLVRTMSTIAEQYFATKRMLILEAEARHTLMVEAAFDPIVSVDGSERITEFNPAAERLFGHLRDNVIGWALADVLIPQRLRNETSARFDQPIGTRVEWTAARADGSEVPVELTVVPTRSDGRGGFTGYMRDLSDRDRAARSEQLWSHVFGQALFGIVITGAQSSTFHAVNRAYATMLGYDRPEDLLGRSTGVVIPPEGHTALPALRAAIDEHGALTFEITLMKKDGSRLSVLSSSSVLAPAPGDTEARRISMVVDVTERRALEAARAEAAALLARSQRIEHASRLKSELLANMSHELRTPLNAIIGFTQLLHDGEVGAVAPKQKEFLGDILTSGEHLLRLINDVLDLAKVEAGKLELHPQRIELPRVIQEVVSMLRTTAAAKAIRVERAVSAEIGEIEIDPARLKQVLYNYLSNALKFTNHGGRVVVHARPEGADAFRVEVEDDGIGIAAANLPRLFVEFEQLDAGISKAHGGTGLGLALTKRLVEAQGGSVGVRSVEGAGSVFHAVLPRHGPQLAMAVPRVAASAPAPAPDAPAPEVARAPVPDDALTILVVEDHAGDRASIEACLLAAGYRVAHAATGTEAIAMCAARAFAAVTLDLILPDMSGLSVLQEIRQSKKNAAVPVIVNSVIAERATAGHIVHDVLAKPLSDGAALLASLRSAGVDPSSPPPRTIVIVDADRSEAAAAATVMGNLGFRCVVCGTIDEAARAIDEQAPAAVVLDVDLSPAGFELLEELTASRASPLAPSSSVPAKPLVLVWTGRQLTPAELAIIRAASSGLARKSGGTAELIAALRSALPHALPVRGAQ